MLQRGASDLKSPDVPIALLTGSEKTVNGGAVLTADDPKESHS